LCVRVCKRDIEMIEREIYSLSVKGSTSYFMVVVVVYQWVAVDVRVCVYEIERKRDNVYKREEFL